MNRIQKAISWFKRNRDNVIRTSFIIPILVAAGISVYHVVAWYGIMNPFAWAVYLSVGVEIAALSALAGMTARMNKFVYVPFFIVTLIQLIGNVFATFEYINVQNESFKDWMLLTEPIFDSIGVVEEGDVLGHRRFLAILGGTFIPIISLSFLHMLVSFNDKVIEKEEDDNVKEDNSFIDKKENENKEEIILEDNPTSQIEQEEVKKEDFEEFVERKKKKLEEDKKIFQPLLDVLYENGIIKKGDVLPTYIHFREKVDPKFSDDNIKMFLTLCNYLNITELSDNIRKAKVDYNEASDIMNKYLSLHDNQEEVQNTENKTEENTLPPSPEVRDWWSKK